MRYQFGMIPAELRALRQWVCWKTVVREGKPTKVLITPKSGDYARTHNQEGKTYRDTPEDTWDTFDAAIASYNRSKGNYDGIGFVFTADDPYCGVDVDDSREHGKLSKEAERIVRQLDSYSEVSPSGTGVHIIVRACLPPSGRRKGHVEMYDQTRYFTMTGLALPGHLEIRNRQVELHALHESIFGKVTAPDFKPRPAVNLSLTDAELIEKARAAKNGGKFQALYDFGCVALYDGDDSRADLALCDMIAFYAGPDESKIDRLMRSSALYRRKWDREDYSRRTIAKVLQTRTEFYKPNGHFEVKDPAPIVDDTEEPPTEEKADPLSETQIGDVERVVARHGRDYLFCEEQGAWYIWDGRCWSQHLRYRIAEDVKAAVRSRAREAVNESDEDKSKRLLKYAMKTATAKHVDDVIRLLKTDKRLQALSRDFDRDPYLLTCLNETVNLKIGTGAAHKRDDRITKCTLVEYDPHAECPLWLRFLARILPDPDVRTFVHRVCGYALTGDVSEQCFFFLHGQGQNGKSVFLDSLLGVFGQYGKPGAPNLLIAKTGDRVPTDVAELAGCRLVTTVEIDEGRHLAEALVKQMTGGDKMKARFMRQDFFEFPPTHKIFMAANHRPVIRGTDMAIWRRVMLIPFTETITEKEKDPHLTRKLSEERVGILNWCVQGCLEWMNGGLQPPTNVRAAVSEYRAEQDVRGRFVDDWCIKDPSATVNATRLYKAFLCWGEKNGEKAETQTAFGRWLTDSGYSIEKTRQSKDRTGLKLTEDAESIVSEWLNGPQKGLRW